MAPFDDRSDADGGTSSVLQDFELEPSPSSTVLHHDPHLTPRTEPLFALAARLMADIERRCAKPGRKRAERSDAKARRKAMVENLIANFTHLAQRQGPALLVSARHQASSRYSRNGFRTATLMRLIADLEATGWLTRLPGVARKARTELRPTARLLEALAFSNAPTATLGRCPGEETILLRSATGSSGREKMLIDYRDTPEAQAMRRDMEAINATLAGADLRFDGKPMPPPHLVRIFQVPSPDAPRAFTSYGRLYRGWWQHLPRGQRHLITINGEAVADLDFQAMFLHLAYARLGLPPPEGDPYAIAGLGHHREAAKKAIAALFSRSGPIRRLPPDLRALLPEGWNAARLMAAILEHHPGIASVLGTDIAPAFQRTESDIMVEVLLGLARQGVSALPMHDGLMTGVGHVAEARATMLEVSARHVGRPLPVVMKAP